MIILQKSLTSQTISFIPREYVASGSNIYNISIVNETTNKSVYDEDTNAFTLNDYYYEYSDVFTLVEDTNQTVTNYSVNNNEYDEQETTNEFIVL